MAQNFIACDRDGIGQCTSHAIVMWRGRLTQRARASAYYEVTRQNVHAALESAGTGYVRNEEPGRERALLLCRLVDRGERRVDHRRDGQVVEADHRDLIGDVQTSRAETCDRAERDQIAVSEQRREV